MRAAARLRHRPTPGRVRARARICSAMLQGVGVEREERVVEALRVVHLQHVRELVEHERAHEMLGQEHQVAVERDRLARRARPPARPLPPHARARVREPRRRGGLGQQRQQPLARGAVEPPRRAPPGTSRRRRPRPRPRAAVPPRRTRTPAADVVRYSTGHVSPKAASSTASGSSASAPCSEQRAAVADACECRARPVGLLGDECDGVAAPRCGTTTTRPSRGVTVRRTRRARLLTRTR